MKFFVMVTDWAGVRFNPRLGGYEKPRCVFNLTKKFPVVEVYAQPTDRLADLTHAFIKGRRVGNSEAIKIICTQPLHLMR